MWTSKDYLNRGWYLVKSSSPGQNGCRFPDDRFKWIVMDGNFCTLIRIPLKFVPKGPVDSKSALVHVMAWCRTGDEPLHEPMLTKFTDAYICGTMGRWVLILARDSKDDPSIWRSGSALGRYLIFIDLRVFAIWVIVGQGALCFIFFYYYSPWTTWQ